MMVFGIGNVCVGHILLGAWILIFAFFLLAMILQTPPSQFFWMALGTSIVALVVAYHAVYDEFTGTATYQAAFGRHLVVESVTRAGSPEKFRAATSFLWGCSLLCGLISAICWRFHYLMEE